MGSAPILGLMGRDPRSAAFSVRLPDIAGKTKPFLHPQMSCWLNVPAGAKTTSHFSDLYGSLGCGLVPKGHQGRHTLNHVSLSRPCCLEMPYQVPSALCDTLEELHRIIDFYINTSCIMDR